MPPKPTPPATGLALRRSRPPARIRRNVLAQRRQLEPVPDDAVVVSALPETGFSGSPDDGGLESTDDDAQRCRGETCLAPMTGREQQDCVDVVGHDDALVEPDEGMMGFDLLEA